MSTNAKVLLVAAFLLGSLTAGCGHNTDSDPSDEDSYKQALAYAKCMRANGVPNYPDPEIQNGGVEVKQPRTTPEMTKALEACRDKQPQGPADDDDGGSIDAAKLADWTKCMRAKLPNFPDADVKGSTVTIVLQGTGISSGSAELENARKACQAQFPEGSLHMVNTP